MQLDTSLDLSILEPLDRLPDSSAALIRYPALGDFREHLGNTALVEVPARCGGARILAKVESTNPFGSVKDRAAFALLCGAITRHGDRPDPLRIVDFSGGNMARALGGLGALTGIPIRLAMPDATPTSLLRQLAAEGVRVDYVPAEEFLFGIIRHAAAIAAADPGLVLLHQHRNVLNLAVHQFATGREILEQLGAAVPHTWVAAIGSGGTIAGVGRALRDRFPNLSIVGVTPDELPYGTHLEPNATPKFAGSGGLGYGHRQPFVAEFVPDAVHRTVSYRRALAGMREFASLTGARIGASAAANWLIASEAASRLTPAETVVTLFADAGTDEDWQRVGALPDS
jgi:cysteine synthase A